MKRTKSKILTICILLALSFFVFTCGKGQYTGYNAPIDGAVNFNGYGECEEQTLTYVSNTTVCWAVSVVTSRSIGQGVETGDSFGTPVEEDVLPANKIQVQLGGANVTVYHAINGSDWILADTPIEELVIPTMIKTNEKGFYQLRVCVPGPAECGCSSSTAELWADIGVKGCKINFTVTPPE